MIKIIKNMMVLCFLSGLLQAQTMSHTPFLPYLEATGGVEALKEAAPHYHNTGLLRLGFGLQKQIFPLTLLGLEAAVQSGHYVRLDNQKTNITVDFNYDLPVYLTYYPPIDVLLTVRQLTPSPLFLQFKAGGMYLNTLISNAEITSPRGWAPELQGGVGIPITQRTRLSLNYQYVFGTKMWLSNVVVEEGTAMFPKLPNLQALLFSLELEL